MLFHLRTPALRWRCTEDLRQFIAARDLELIVATFLRRLVEPPAQKNRGMAKTRALQVVVFHFAHALDAQRFPRQVLAGAPAALPARHARLGSARLGPVAPGMLRERVFSQRLELPRE